MGSFGVVGAAFLLNAFTMGPIKSYGPFFIRFEEDLNASAGQSSLASSLLYGAFFLVGPFSSILSNRFGFRKTITLGTTVAFGAAIGCAFSQAIFVVHVTALLIGAGCGLATIPAFALLGMRFKEKRSLANNVMTMGSALLAIPLSPLVQVWIDEYSWRGAILLLGGLLMNGLPSGLVLTSDSKYAKSSTKRKLMDTSLLKSPKFLAYMIACGCDMAAMVCVTVYLVRYTQSCEVDNYVAASLSSLLGIIDLSLRPISGYITSLSHIGRFPIVRSYIFSGIALIQAFVVFSYTASTSIYAIVAVTALYAICVGCRGALAITLTADFFGPENLVNAIGLRYFAVGVFSAAAPPLVGEVVDSTGSYAPPFYASAVFSVISGGLVASVQAAISREKRMGKGNVQHEVEMHASERKNKK